MSSVLLLAIWEPLIEDKLDDNPHLQYMEPLEEYRVMEQQERPRSAEPANEF